MKNPFYLMIIGIVFLTNCGSKVRHAPPPPSDSTTRSSDTVKHVQFELNYKTLPFTAKDAEDEIKKLVEHPKLQPWRIKWALGGEFIDIGDFFPKNESDTNKGTMMWFTFDGTNMSPDRNWSIILGCESWDRRDKLKDPVDSTLTAPDKVFTFGGPAPNFKLRDHGALTTRPIGRSMQNAEVRRRINLYNNNLRSRLHVRGTKPFNTDHGAFFQNNVEKKGDTIGLLTRFVNQPGAVGMRYYFALDRGEPRNKIRIFLIATDSAGNNMLYATKDRNAAPLILQKSIPPGQR